jgi:MFS family permease
MSIGQDVAAAEAIRPRPHRLGLLARSRAFRLLWSAHTVSVVGDAVTLVALPTVAILTLHAGGLAVALITSSWAIAWGLLGLPAGVWTDRLPRRRVMIACDLVRAVVLASIPIAYAADTLRIWQLILVAAFAAAANVFFTSAATTYLPEILPPADFTEANARLELSSSSSLLVGPPLAGAMIAVVGAPLALLADAFSFLGSASFLRWLPPAERQSKRRPEPHFRRELTAGLRAIRERPILIRITCGSGISNVGLAASQAVLLLFVYRGLHLSPLAAGVALALGAAGSIGGALAAPRLVRRFGTGQLLFLATTLEGLALLPIGFALLGLPVFWVAFALAARGFFNPLWNVNVPTVRQTLVPLELQGRVSAVLRMVGFGAAPLGALAGGAVGQLLANRYGDANGYALTLAGASVVAAASGFALSSRSVRRFRLGDAD